jgi:single-strand DNA-binding protein
MNSSGSRLWGEADMSTASVNHIVLIGNVGAAPELRYLPSGDPVAKFSIATTDYRSNGDAGGFTGTTEWHRIALYGKQAEVAGQFLKKGSQVYVEGKIRSSTWTDPKGVKRKSWSIVANRFQMLGKAESSRTIDATTADSTKKDMAWMDGPVPPTQPVTVRPAARPDEFDDDIPF